MKILIKFLLVTALAALMACNTSGSSDELIVAITLPIRQVGPNGNVGDFNFLRGLAYGGTDAGIAFEGSIQHPIAPALWQHATDLGFSFPAGHEVVVRISPAQLGRITQFASNSTGTDSPMDRGPGNGANAVHGLEGTGFSNVIFFRMAAAWRGYGWEHHMVNVTAADFLNTPFPINAFGGGVINYTINRRSTPAYSAATIAASGIPTGGTGAPSEDGQRQLGFILVGPRSAFEKAGLVVAEGIDTNGNFILP
ncbi:MAG: hypothetical protein FWE37_08490 [Spirochaetaceae bacterium]|nr:hypothetical protein [Spirochaetaceae bacterium]